MRSLEAALKLAVLPSCLGVTVLGRPPLLEETSGVIAIIRVGGVRRQVQCGSSDAAVEGPLVLRGSGHTLSLRMSLQMH